MRQPIKFNQLVLEKLHFLFAEHGLILLEQSANIVKYESDKVIVILSNNPQEFSNSLWVGRKYSSWIELDDQIMQEHFKSDIALSNITLEAFINNVFLFFTGDGEKLLKGDERAIINLEKFHKQRSSEYTISLLEKQNLDLADAAWKNGNYSDVIKYLQRMNRESLSELLKQRYKIAQLKIGK